MGLPLGPLHRQVLVSPKKAIPKLNVLCVVAEGHGVVASVESGVEHTDVDVDTRVTQSTDKHDGVHRDGNSDDVNRARREDPEARDR